MSDWQGIICIFVVICLVVFFIRKSILKRRTQPLWDSEDEEELKESFKQIYSATSIDNLMEVYGEAFRKHAKYQYIIGTAMQEKRQQLTGVVERNSFEKRERIIRRVWLVSFFIYYTTSLCSLFLIGLSDFSQKGDFWTVLGCSMFLTACSAIFPYIIYRSAYIRKRNFWLYGIFIMGPLKTLENFKDYSLSIETLIYLAIAIFFWISCGYLKGANDEAWAQKQISGIKALIYAE